MISNDFDYIASVLNFELMYFNSQIETEQAVYALECVAKQFAQDLQESYPDKFDRERFMQRVHEGMSI